MSSARPSLDVPAASFEIAKRAATEAAGMFRSLPDNTELLRQITRSAATMATSLDTGGKILACGNGGSMSDAIHLAEELTGRFRADRRPLAALALSDAGHLTCVGNDFGYDDVFARAVEALGKEGDVLVGFSTSGQSPNVVKALSQARTCGLHTVALTGRAGSPAEEVSSITIVTHGGQWADRVQELHGFVIHCILELIEYQLGLA